MISQTLTIARKDIKTGFRTGEIIFFMAFFPFFILVTFYFAFEFYEIEQEELDPLVSPILWTTSCLAGIFGLFTSFSKERDLGSLGGLFLCPMDRSAIYFGKVISNYFLILLIDTLSVILFAWFFQFDYHGNILSILVVVFFGTFCFVISATLMMGIGMNSRSIRGMLLSLLLVPIILLTVLMPSINATSKALEGKILDAIPELRILVALAFVFIAIAYLSFDYIVEE